MKRGHSNALEQGGEEEAALVRRARDGDLEAFGELARRYQQRLYILVYNMTSHREDAEDLVQDIFLRVQQALPRFKGRSSFYTWLYRIAVNHTLSFLKKRGRRQVMSLDDLDERIVADETYQDLAARSSPRRAVQAREIQERLNAALGTLSNKQRMVVVLHDIQGIPHERIAAMTKCSAGTIRSRLYYARRLLQAQLQDLVT